MMRSKWLLVCGRAGKMLNGRGRITEEESELSTVVGRDNWETRQT
jgi:hypothetical protein